MTYHTHEQVMAGAVERIITRHALSRRDVLAIVLFLADRSLVRGIFDYVRGVGPAAQAAGRAGVRTHPAPRTPAGMAAASRGDAHEMAMPRAA